MGTVNGNIVLREGTPADVSTLVTLVQTAFAEYRGRLDPPSGAEKEDEATLARALAHGGAGVACVDGVAVGCVFYHRDRDAGPLTVRPARLEFVYFGRLSVAPAFRRRGIAEALTGYVEQRAREMGVGRVQLGVRLALPHLQSYYERLGYRVIRHESHRGYARPTSAVMEKTLDP